MTRILDRIHLRLNDLQGEVMDLAWIEFGADSFNEIVEVCGGLMLYPVEEFTVKKVFGYEVRKNLNLLPGAIEPVVKYF